MNTYEIEKELAKISPEDIQDGVVKFNMPGYSLSIQENVRNFQEDEYSYQVDMVVVAIKSKANKKDISYYRSLSGAGSHGAIKWTDWELVKAIEKKIFVYEPFPAMTPLELLNSAENSQLSPSNLVHGSTGQIIKANGIVFELMSASLGDDYESGNAECSVVVKSGNSFYKIQGWTSSYGTPNFNNSWQTVTPKTKTVIYYE